MIAAINHTPPRGAVVLQRIAAMLETVLHLGVHRCATTSFQAYLDQNADALATSGVAAWTPKMTRSAMFAGLVRPPEAETANDLAMEKNASALITAQYDRIAASGARNLLVSEENMIGTPRDNLARGALYPHLSQRLARFVRAFGAKIDHIGLCIRSYEDYWASVLAYSVASGGDVPLAVQTEQLAHQPRNWSQIVAEVARAAPNAKITVWTFEAFAGRPRRQFNMLTGRIDVAGLLDQSPNWKNTSRNCNKLRYILKTKGRMDMAARLPRGGGTWMPFNDLERAVMRAQYADDKACLRRAGPQITFHETTAIKVPRKSPTRLTGHDMTGGQYEPTRQMV
jgi:hypothetical protein